MWRLVFITTYIFFTIIKIQCTILNADCNIEELTESDWETGYVNDPVDDFEKNEFKKFSVKNIKGVEINGTEYGKYFGSKLKEQYLSIFPTNIFKTFEINEKSIINPEMYVGLIFNCTIGKKHLTFRQPIRDHNTFYPTFEEPLYVYNLPMPLPAEFDISSFGKTIIACDLDISNIGLNVAINPAEDFSIISNGPINDANKCHKFVLKTINALRLEHSKEYIITVSDMGVPRRVKTVDFKIEINEETSLPPNPQFDSAYYQAIYESHEENHIISLVNPISLRRGCSNLKFAILESEYQDNFRVKCVLDEVIVELNNNLPVDIWNDSVLRLTLLAILEYAERPGRTVLEIFNPDLEQLQTSTVDTCDVECSTCPTVANDTECTQSSVAADIYNPSTLHYQTRTDIIQVEYCHIGYLDTVTAMPLPKEDILYYLPFESDILEYNRSTGVLRKVKCLSPNTMHYFTVCAKGLTSGSISCTKVLVHEPGSYTGSLSSQIMYVRHISEEREGFIELPCNYQCTCTIFQQYPLLSEELFICESDRIYASSIDREMEDLVNMKSPQFTLHLNLEVADFSREKRSTKNNFKEQVFIPHKVYDEPNQILLTIIIDDINDNPPSFQTNGKLIVGYPIKELVDQISPLYLTKVVATDPDAGDNAAIRYSINTTNINVLIHPKTGIIYPCLDAFDNTTNLTFTVRATDRNGSEEGLWTDLEVEVKLLMSHHILDLQIHKALPENVDAILMKASNVTGFQINYLNATFILKNGGPNYFTEVLLYGLLENEPVNATDLKEAIQHYILNSETFYNIEFKNIQLAVHNEGCGCENSVTNFCVIIPTILLLLLVTLLIMGAHWYYKNYMNRKSN